MPGVPLDAVAQVKKGFKSLFRKKHEEHDEHVSSEPAAIHHHVDTSYQSTTSQPGPPQQAPVPAAGDRPTDSYDWQDVDQDDAPPPPPPEKDYPRPDVPAQQHLEPSHNTGNNPELIVTPATGSVQSTSNPTPAPESEAEPTKATNTADTTPAAAPPAPAAPVLPRVDTSAKPATGTPASPTSPASQASTITEAYANPVTDRDDSPLPAMSATSGPLPDQPSFG